MNGGMERARRLTQVRGVAVFLSPFLFFSLSFCFVSAGNVCTSLYLSFVSGDEG